MLMHLRVTPVVELEAGEVVRLGQRIVVVREVTEGSLAYRGVSIAVAYVSGRSYDGPAEVVLPASERVIAGR